MAHVHWSLAGVAFALGLLLTSAMMVRPAQSEAPVKKTPRVPGAKSKPAMSKAPGAGKPRPMKRPAARKPSTARAPVVKRPPGAKRPAAKASAAGRIPVAGEAATEQIPAADEAATEQLAEAAAAPTAHIPLVPYAPYGPGSARADAGGSGPAGWPVKGRSDTRLYYTPGDTSYDPTVAQVWFQDEETAVRAFFTPWRKSAQRK